MRIARAKERASKDVNLVRQIKENGQEDADIERRGKEYYEGQLNEETSRNCIPNEGVSYTLLKTKK